MLRVPWRRLAFVVRGVIEVGRSRLIRPRPFARYPDITTCELRAPVDTDSGSARVNREVWPGGRTLGESPRETADPNENSDRYWFDLRAWLDETLAGLRAQSASAGSPGPNRLPGDTRVLAVPAFGGCPTGT